MNPRNPQRCPDEDTPSTFQRCEVHAMRMDAIEDRMNRLEDDGVGRDRILRGHDQDPGLISRLANLEKAFAESQSHRKWLIGIVLGVLVNIGLAALPLLLKEIGN